MGLNHLHISGFRLVASLGFALLLTYGIFILFQPFLIPLVTGAVIALICRPLYKSWQKYLSSPALSAFFTVVVVGLLFVIPLTLIFTILIREINYLGQTIGSQSFSLDHLDILIQQTLDTLGISRDLVQVDMRGFLLSAVSYLGSKGGVFIGGFFGVLAHAFLIFITTYYLVQNYDQLNARVKELSPFSPEDTDHLLQRTKEVIQATVSGNLLILILQALTSLIGFTLFGLGSPVLLGLLFGIASLVPIVGTAIIWVPAVIFQLMQGNVTAGLGIGIWSLLQVLLFDYYLRPRLIEQKARLHPFLVILGVLGGVAQFGILGLILGPTMVALGLIGIEILQRAWQLQPE